MRKHFIAAVTSRTGLVNKVTNQFCAEFFSRVAKQYDGFSRQKKQKTLIKIASFIDLYDVHGENFSFFL